MGITMFTFSGLFPPLQAFMNWIAPSPRRASAQQLTNHPATRIRMPSRAHRPVSAVTMRRAPPLRVVRVVEAGGAPAGAGRMIMSGRMADVCAELDRLAALEAAAG